MSRVLITGSADGIGFVTGEQLTAQGHQVTLHARNEKRASECRAALPGAENIVVGDVSTVAGMQQVASEANAGGGFDALIHNVGVGIREPRRETADGLSNLFAVNVLAPYMLTALIESPQRLIYVSSAWHRDGDPDLSDPQWTQRPWDGKQAYTDSKLLDVVLAFGVARRRPNVLCNAVEPGWVQTKMSGPGATDEMSLGAVTQVWLAVSDDPNAKVSEGYFYHQRRAEVHPAARDVSVQEELLDYCASLTGVQLT